MLFHTSTFGPFSVVSTPIFASKSSFFSISRDLQDVHSFAPVQSQQFSNFVSNDFDCFCWKCRKQLGVFIKHENVSEVHEMSRNFVSTCIFQTFFFLFFSSSFGRMRLKRHSEKTSLLHYEKSLYRLEVLHADGKKSYISITSYIS